jgi:hypothetical protein
LALIGDAARLHLVDLVIYKKVAVCLKIWHIPLILRAFLKLLYLVYKYQIVGGAKYGLLNTIASLHVELQVLMQVCCGDTTARKKNFYKKAHEFHGLSWFFARGQYRGSISVLVSFCALSVSACY